MAFTYVRYQASHKPQAKLQVLDRGPKLAWHTRVEKCGEVIKYSAPMFSSFSQWAASVAKWVRSLYFSALNHSIISPLCLV